MDSSHRAVHIKHATAHNGPTAPMYIEICRKLCNNYGIGLWLGLGLGIGLGLCALRVRV